MKKLITGVIVGALARAMEHHRPANALTPPMSPMSCACSAWYCTQTMANRCAPVLS
jgi:hypothetical protein